MSTYKYTDKTETLVHIVDEEGNSLKSMEPEKVPEGVTIYPAPPKPPRYKIRFSSNDYLERFTQIEQEAIATATLSNVQVKLYYDKLLAADYIDLNDSRTEGGLDALIALGLLDAERKPILLEPELIED
jgi:hypothetical protein